jgi:methionyl-tRNA formyltransferase
VAYARLAGDTQTGVTLLRMDEGLDTGPMLAQVATPMAPGEDRGRLTARLADLAAGLLVDSLPAATAGELPGRPQDPAAATLAPPLRKADGALDWSRPAAELGRRIQAFTPEPGAFTFIGARRRLIRKAAAGTAPGPLAPGELGAAVTARGVPVGCGGGTALWLLQVQPAGRGEMDAEAAARGRHLPAGTVLGLPAR